MNCVRHYKPKGAGVGPQARTRAVLPVYAALFAERKPDGFPLTLAEIGARMGVGRENVRQIRRRYFPELGSQRDDRHAHYDHLKAVAKFANPWFFRQSVRRWLAAEGYFQCCTCRLVRCEDDRTLGLLRRCKACTSANARAWRKRRRAARAESSTFQHTAN